MIIFNNNNLNFAEYLLDLINQIVSDEKEFIATIDVNTTDGKITHLNCNINRDYRGFKEYDEE